LKGVPSLGSFYRPGSVAHHHLRTRSRDPNSAGLLCKGISGCRNTINNSPLLAFVLAMRWSNASQVQPIIARHGAELVEGADQPHRLLRAGLLPVGQQFLVVIPIELPKPIRRAGTGKLTQVLGPSAIERDRLARGELSRRLKREWAAFGPGTRAIVTACTDGITMAGGARSFAGLDLSSTSGLSRDHHSGAPDQRAGRQQLAGVRHHDGHRAARAAHPAPHHRRYDIITSGSPPSTPGGLGRPKPCLVLMVPG